MKVLELKEAPPGLPGWWGLTIEGKKEKVLVHWNWFAARQELGLKKLEVGDDVEFEDSTYGYSNKDEYTYVKNFHVKDEGEIL